MAWLENLTAVFKPAAPRELQLGAFGKHPGWDDHLEDFGLESEALLGARQLVYVRGIGGAIDAALWDNLPPENVLPEFDHTLTWFSESDTLLARVWSSSDRKGRKRYPMILCVHVPRQTDDATLERLLAELKTVEGQCKIIKSGPAILGILSAARRKMREIFLAAANASRVPPLVSREGVAQALEMKANPEQWARICYAVETQLTAFTAGKLSPLLRKIGGKMLEANVVAQALRLPSRPATGFPVAQFWRDFIDERLGEKAPLLILQSDTQNWADVIVGTPGPQQMFCLKAGPGALPPTADIPYTLPPGFLDKAGQILAAFCRGNPA